MEAVKSRVSFADLQRMPDDGHRYELYEGELRVVPSPLPGHQIVSGRLYEVLLDYRRDHGGQVFYAPLDLVLSDYDVVQPDLMYFGPARAHGVRPDQYIRFPPDLAIEVLSPSTAGIDRGRKRDLLARYGLPELWIVDTGVHVLEVSVLRAERFAAPLVFRGGAAESATLPGLILDVAALFEGIDTP